MLYTQSQDSDAEIRQLIHRGQREGEFRPDLSAAWLTEAFYKPRRWRGVAHPGRS